MVNAYKLEGVLAMALRLAPKERLRLIEQVAALGFEPQLRHDLAVSRTLGTSAQPPDQLA